MPFVLVLNRSATVTSNNLVERQGNRRWTQMNADGTPVRCFTAWSTAEKPRAFVSSLQNLRLSASICGFLQPLRRLGNQIVIGVADDFHPGEFPGPRATLHVNPAVNVRRIRLPAGD